LKTTAAHPYDSRAGAGILTLKGLGRVGVRGRDRGVVEAEAAVVVRRLRVLMLVDAGQFRVAGGAQAEGLVHNGRDDQREHPRVSDRHQRCQRLAAELGETAAVEQAVRAGRGGGEQATGPRATAAPPLGFTSDSRGPPILANIWLVASERR
jgi:hypothetical protein